VLDEATNNLDSASETRVLDALKRSRPELLRLSSRTAKLMR
jgi:ABC-type bacteriocin/lantibiotic exporter with double-glycine peptidase domain